MRINLHIALSHAKILVIVSAKKTCQLITLKPKVIPQIMAHLVFLGILNKIIASKTENIMELIGAQSLMNGVTLV